MPIFFILKPFSCTRRRYYQATTRLYYPVSKLCKGMCRRNEDRHVSSGPHVSTFTGFYHVGTS